MVENCIEDKKRIRMKTYRNLWSEFISDENIKLAIKNFSKGKKKRNKIKKILADEEKYIPIIRDYAINFKNEKHIPKEIYDGISRKKRTIVVPTTMECIVHHMIVNVLKPMFMTGMYEHSYGSVPKRGCHYGKKCINKWIAKGGKNIKYCAQLDIRHFYQNISQDKLIKKLKRKIHDHRFMRLVEKVIRATPQGLPLGFYTSVWFANWYLADLDRSIKDIGVKYYARYVDDMVLFYPNKRKLHSILQFIGESLHEISCSLKDNWQIFRFVYSEKNHKRKGRALDFMGFKFFRNRTTLRKSILLKIKRKALHIWGKGKTTIYDSKQMVSAIGWLNDSDTYNYCKNNVKPFVDFDKCKNIISISDRRKARLAA